MFHPSVNLIEKTDNNERQIKIYRFNNNMEPDLFYPLVFSQKIGHPIMMDKRPWKENELNAKMNLIKTRNKRLMYLLSFSLNTFRKRLNFFWTELKDGSWVRSDYEVLQMSCVMYILDNDGFKMIDTKPTIPLKSSITSFRLFENEIFNTWMDGILFQYTNTYYFQHSLCIYEITDCSNDITKEEVIDIVHKKTQDIIREF